jgi:ribosomal protein S18 acetylase RimI-like enzyme
VILEELIGEAFDAVDERPFLGLLVHVQNARAAAFYRNAGFHGHGKPFVERSTGQPHQKMIYDLRMRTR